MQSGVDSHPDLKGTPIVTELARNQEERTMLEFVAGNSRIGRAVVSPPGQPLQRVVELRAAFLQVMKDADFLEEIRRDKLDLAPMSGEELQKFIQDSANIPPALIERAKVLAEFKE